MPCMNKVDITHATLMERPLGGRIIVFGLLEIDPAIKLNENEAMVLKTSATEQGVYTLSPNDVELMQKGIQEDPRILTAEDYMKRPVWASLYSAEAEAQGTAFNMVRVFAAEPEHGRYILFGAGDMPLAPLHDKKDHWFKLSGNHLTEVPAPASTAGGNLNTILNMPIWDDQHGDRYRLSYLSPYAMEGARALHTLYLQDAKGEIESDIFKARLKAIQDTYLLGFGDYKDKEYRDYLVQLDSLCTVTDRHRMLMSAAEVQEIERCSKQIIKAQMYPELNSEPDHEQRSPGR